MVLDKRVEYAEIPGKDGYMGILPGHAALLSELLIGIKGNIRYNYRTSVDRVNSEGAERRVITTRIRAEGTIVARIAHRGPEVTVEFSCDSGMPLAPALVESPYDISPLPSI